MSVFMKEIDVGILNREKASVIFDFWMYFRFVQTSLMIQDMDKSSS